MILLRSAKKRFAGLACAGAGLPLCVDLGSGRLLVLLQLLVESLDCLIQGRLQHRLCAGGGLLFGVLDLLQGLFQQSRCLLQLLDICLDPPASPRLQAWPPATSVRPVGHPKSGPDLG